MNSPIADLQKIGNHSTRDLRASYCQVLTSSTGLRVGDIQEKPGILIMVFEGSAIGEGRFHLHLQSKLVLHG